MRATMKTLPALSPKLPAVLPGLILGAALAGWAVVCTFFPVYFQRDDLYWILDWSMNNSWIDAFWIRDPQWDLAGRTAPVIRLLWMSQQRLFGLNAWAYHFVLGAVFLFSLYFLFRLIRRAHGLPAAVLAVAIWPMAFQNLMTTLFWFIDICHVAEMLFVCAGLYVFLRGLSPGRRGLAGGLGLMVLALYTREPSRVILPTAGALLLAFNARELRGWSRGKALGIAAVPVILAAIYVLGFHRYGTTAPDPAAGAEPLLTGMRTRLLFYGRLLTSGSAGAALMLPAAYVLCRKLLPRWPALAAAAGLALAVAARHWTYAGLALLLAGGLCLPVRCWFFIPWTFVPLGGLLFIRDIIPTYAFELSYGAAALAGMQAAILLKDLQSGWPANRTVRTVLRTAGVLALAGALGAGGLKLRQMTRLLRLRSDMTMLLKEATPGLRRLPPDATLAVIDYRDMGIDFIADMIHWSQREKILTQSPIVPAKWAGSWLRVIGRGDVRVAGWDARPPDAFLLLMTRKERAFFLEQGLPHTVLARMERGKAAAWLVRLGEPTGPSPDPPSPSFPPLDPA